MPDLAEQIRAYVDALVDADPIEGVDDDAPVVHAADGSPGWRRRFAVGLAAASVGAVFLVAFLVGRGASDDVVTVPPLSGSPAFVPNETVPTDVIETQAMGATVVVPVRDGLYLSAVREGAFVCVQLNPVGRDDGPRSCDMPASAAWPDGPVFSRQVLLGDRRFAVGAVAAERIAEVAVDGPGETRDESLAEVTMPFPTLRFFLLESGGARAVNGFDASGRLVSSTVLRESSRDARPPTTTATTLTGASASDVNVGRLVAAFALEPDEENFKAIPFVDGPVRLLFQGESVSGFASADELVDPVVWEVEQRTADGGTDRISALAVLRSHPQDDLGFYPGPYDGCATSPEPVDFAYDAHVIIEPDSIDSCADWFGVDLYLDRGRIVAVGLVLPAS